MSRRSIVALAAVLVFGACNSGSGVVIDEGADGTTVTLAVGDTLEVGLPGNPSTGYIWEPDGLDESVLRWTGAKRFEPESTLVGAPGTIPLTFEAMAPGTVTLDLVYHRQFETGEPADTFSVTVIVEE